MNTAGHDAVRRVVLLRHGDTIAPAGALLGRSDPPLSEQGLCRVHTALARLAAWGPPIDAVVSSPRQRCRISAQAFATGQGVPCVVDARWAELDFGDWDGLLPSDLSPEQRSAYQRWRNAPDGASPPQGEPFAQFRDRLAAAHAALPDQPRVLVLSHAGAIRARLADALGLPWSATARFALPYAGWVELSYCGGAPPYLIGLGAPEPLA